jgi:hypothetical protein
VFTNLVRLVTETVIRVPRPHCSEYLPDEDSQEAKKEKTHISSIVISLCVSSTIRGWAPLYEMRCLWYLEQVFNDSSVNKNPPPRRDGMKESRIRCENGLEALESC